MHSESSSLPWIFAEKHGAEVLELLEKLDEAEDVAREKWEKPVQNFYFIPALLLVLAWRSRFFESPTERTLD